MNEAENRLKEKEYLVMSASKQSSSSSRISGTSGLLGSKDVFISNEEESVDSDLSMRGKVIHRWVGEAREEEKEDETAEEDYEEDEDDKYYENKLFEKKDCDIIVESSEESNEAVQQDEEEVIIDSSDDEEASSIQKMNFSWAAATTKTIGDEEIARLIEEETIETASTSVNFNEDEELSVEEIDQNTSMEIHIETPSESPPIEILDSPTEDKPSGILFAEESLAKAGDDVIEIESDEEKPGKAAADIPAGKILFSSMFSSQEEEEEYSEDDQPDKPADVESDPPGN